MPSKHKTKNIKVFFTQNICKILGKYGWNYQIIWSYHISNLIVFVPRYKLSLYHTPIKLYLPGFLGIDIFASGLFDHVFKRFALIVIYHNSPYCYCLQRNIFVLYNVFILLSLVYLMFVYAYKYNAMCVCMLVLDEIHEYMLLLEIFVKYKVNIGVEPMMEKT